MCRDAHQGQAGSLVDCIRDHMAQGERRRGRLVHRDQDPGIARPFVHGPRHLTTLGTASKSSA